MAIALKSKLRTRLPRLSIVDRYVAGELILPFLFGLGIFTALIVAIGTGFELLRKVTESGLLLQIAIRVLLLRLPGFIVWAFPMSVLLATLMAYSRLSSDSEVVALRSIGISVHRIVLPGIVLSLLVTAFTFVVNDFIAPAANYQASITLETALDRVKPAFKEQNIIYPEYGEVKQPDGEKRTVLTRLFYADEYNGEQMQNVTILDRSQAGVSQIINAQSAAWNLEENIWDFFNGTIYVIAPDGSYRNIVRFQHQKLALPRTPVEIAKRERDYNEMNFFQAQEYLRVLQLSGSEKKIRKLKVRIQEKLAFPFVCLVFGLVGATLGLRPQTSRATSFGICVGIIFGYYLLSFITNSLGVWGVLSPIMAVWLPNLLGLGVGGVLLMQSSR